MSLETEKIDTTTHMEEETKFGEDVKVLSESIQNDKGDDIEENTIIIKKNDSIKDIIEEVLKLLNNKKTVLLVGKSVALNRLITIVEIVKSKGPVHQYNQLSNQQSRENPNYSRQKTRDNVRAGDQHLNGKIYYLPILYVVLSTEPITINESWSKQ